VLSRVLVLAVASARWHVGEGGSVHAAGDEAMTPFYHENTMHHHLLPFDHPPQIKEGWDFHSHVHERIRRARVVHTSGPNPAPEEEWDRTLGGSNFDEGNSVQQTSDGGYIIAGYTCSYGASDEDVWLIKVGSEVSASTKPVPNINTGEDFETIQAAIDDTDN